MIPRFGCRRRIVSYGTPRRGRPWLTRPMSLFARACRSRPPQVSCQSVSMPREPGRLGVAVRKGSIGAWPCIDLRDISCRPGGRAQKYYIITIIRPITDKREIQTGPDTAWAVRGLVQPPPLRRPPAPFARASEAPGARSGRLRCLRCRGEARGFRARRMGLKCL